jgi:hypothetical protein
VSKNTKRPKQKTQHHLTSPMSEGGEPKQNTQNRLTSPMSEGGELKQNTQNHLKSPMSEGGEPKQNTQNYLTSPMSEGGEPKICINTLCCFSAKHAALKSKSKDWLSRNEDNMSEWSDMFTHTLLFQ